MYVCIYGFFTYIYMWRSHIYMGVSHIYMTSSRKLHAQVLSRVVGWCCVGSSAARRNLYYKLISCNSNLVVKRIVCTWNYRSFLQKSPIKETIFCKRDLYIKFGCTFSHSRSHIYIASSHIYMTSSRTREVCTMGWLRSVGSIKL